MFGALWAWMPSVPEFVAGLSYVERETVSPHLVAQGFITQREYDAIARLPQPQYFSLMSQFTGDHWIIPFGAIAIYLVLVFYGPVLMANRSAAAATAHVSELAPAREGARAGVAADTWSSRAHPARSPSPLSLRRTGQRCR
jgi:hypothetical protein